MSSAKFSSSILSKSARKLYLNHVASDVHFVVNGSAERIPAHKCLLIVASKVFRSKFNGLWKDKDEITINTPVAAFKEFLQYFYYDEIKLSLENVEEVMKLVKMFDIPECFKQCLMLIEWNLSIENVCLWHGIAIQFDKPELINECEALISLNTEEVLKSATFLDCNHETLSHILRLNSISCSEVDIFNGCMTWIKSKSKKNTLTKEIVQSQLGNLFYDIRFGLMTAKEFNAIYKSYGFVFTHDDRRTISEMITLKGKAKSKKNQAKFNMDQRQNAWNQKNKLKCNRDYDILCEAYKIKKIETTTFSTDKTLLLHDIVCVNICGYYCDPVDELDPFDENLPINITILEIHPDKGKNNSQIIYEDKNAELISDGNMEISLSKPILIKRGFKYQIRIKQTSQADDFGYSATILLEKVIIRPDINVEFVKGPTFNGENCGLIVELRFSTIF